MAETKKPRRSGIPTGNAGEYFVMGELLRRGYDAQLADRNTKGYDLLVGIPSPTAEMRKVQVKSVRLQPWYVSRSKLKTYPDQLTVYVLIGKEDSAQPIRYFVARNREVAAYVHSPKTWNDAAFLKMPVLSRYEVRTAKDWAKNFGNPSSV